MKRKTLVMPLILVLLVLALIFAGCQKKEGEEQQAEGEEPSEEVDEL